MWSGPEFFHVNRYFVLNVFHCIKKISSEWIIIDPESYKVLTKGKFSEEIEIIPKTEADLEDFIFGGENEEKNDYCELHSNYFKIELQNPLSKINLYSTHKILLILLIL